MTLTLSDDANLLRKELMSRNVSLNRNRFRPFKRWTFDMVINARYLQHWHSNLNSISRFCLEHFYKQNLFTHTQWSASLVCMVVNLCCLVQCSQEYRIRLAKYSDQLRVSLSVSVWSSGYLDTCQINWELLLDRNNKGTINKYILKSL